MTAEEEFDLRMELSWYKDALNSLESAVKKFTRWFLRFISCHLFMVLLLEHWYSND